MQKDLFKRILRTFVCLSLAAGCTLCTAALPSLAKTGKAAAENFDYDTVLQTPEGLIYEISGENAVIKGYTGEAGELVIPDEIEGRTVSEIGEKAFYENTALTLVAFPDTVSTIGEKAFYGCENMTFKKLPDALYLIGRLAFCHCGSLNAVVLPAGVMTFGAGAFSCCGGITEMNVSENSVKYRAVSNCIIEKRSQILVSGCNASVIPLDTNILAIGDFAFYGCTGIESVSIPKSVASIGERAFADCTGLVSLKMSDGVTTVGEASFSGCTSLSYITFSQGVTELPAHLFDGCASLTSFDIPSGVKLIGKYAFGGCGIKKLFIPKLVFTIENFAFAFCRGIEAISVEDGNVVFSSQGNCIIDKRAKTLVLGCKTSRVPLDDSVRVIGNGAFCGCDGLRSVVLPALLSMVGYQAFYGCSSLRSVYFAGSEEQWHNVKTEDGNECLEAAAIIFGRETEIMTGDVNDDGETDSADAALVLKYDAGITYLSKIQLAVSDYNDDGETDSADAALILRFDAGLV